MYGYYITMHFKYKTLKRSNVTLPKLKLLLIANEERFEIHYIHLPAVILIRLSFL